MTAIDDSGAIIDQHWQMIIDGTKPLGWGISQGEPDDSFREYSRQDQDMALTAANDAEEALAF